MMLAMSSGSLSIMLGFSIRRCVPCHVCAVAVVQAKVPACMLLVAREQRFVVSLFLDLQRFVESRCSVITNPELKPACRCL